MFANSAYLLAAVATISVVSATSSVPLPKRVRSAFSSIKTIFSGAKSSGEIEMTFPTVTSLEEMRQEEVVFGNVIVDDVKQDVTTDEAMTLRTSSSSDSFSQNNLPDLTFTPSTPVASSIEDMLILMNEQRKTHVLLVPENLMIDECPKGYSISAIEPNKVSLLDLHYVLHSLEKASAVSKDVFVFAIKKTEEDDTFDEVDDAVVETGSNKD